MPGPGNGCLILYFNIGEFLLNVLVLVLHAPRFFEHARHHLVLLLREYGPIFVLVGRWGECHLFLIDGFVRQI